MPDATTSAFPPAFPDPSSRCTASADVEADAPLAHSCVKRVPIFAGASEQQLAELSGAVRSQHYAKGSLVFREGDHSDALYIVSRGVVKLSKLSAAGKEQILRFLFPGDFFGQFALLREQQHYASAEAIDDAIVCSLRRDDFRRLLDGSATLAYHFLLAVTDRLQQADEWMGAMNLLEVEKRLAKLLLYFYHKQASAGDRKLHLPVAKKELASMIGTTPETVSRKLALFKEQALIATPDRSTVVVLDPQRLERLAGAV